MKIHGLIMYALVLLTACGSTVVTQPTVVSTYHCDAEGEIDGDNFVDSLYSIGGAKKRSAQAAKSGQYAVQADKGAFVFTLNLGPMEQGQYIKAKVWRKGAGGRGNLVITAHGDEKAVLYEKTAAVVQEAGEWGLLHLEAFIPPNYNGQDVKVYCWNPHEPTVWYDDLSVEVHPKRIYPVETGLNKLTLTLDTSAMNALENKRREAFELGHLVTNGKDYQQMILSEQNKEWTGTTRLKGDWLDHLKGDKWSYRIKLDSGLYNGMHTFSLQTPASRSFLNEWILHKWAQQEDVLTTLYDFVELEVNGQGKGVYAVEEHFATHLLTKYNRPDGPVFRFAEEGFWEVIDGAIPPRVYMTAAIDPFGGKRIKKKAKLSDQFAHGRQLLHDYRIGKRTVSEVFDVDLLARYYAISAVSQGMHGFIWHNIRFYYHPEKQKLEPILYDAFGGYESKKHHPLPGSKTGCESTYNRGEDYFLYRALEDASFVELYTKYVGQYASTAYQQGLRRTLGPTADKLAKVLGQEFEFHHFDFAKWQQRADQISKDLLAFKDKNCTFKIGLDTSKAALGTEHLTLTKYSSIVAFSEATSDSTMNVTLQSAHPRPIYVVGFATKKSEHMFKKAYVLAPYSSATPNLVIADLPEVRELLISESENGQTISCPVDPWGPYR